MQKNQYTATDKEWGAWEKRRHDIVLLRDRHGWTFARIAQKYNISRQMAWRLYHKGIE